MARNKKTNTHEAADEAANETTGETVEPEQEFEDEEATENEEKIDPVYEAIKAAFSDAIEAEKDEDDIKMAMIGAGAKFKNVAVLYNRLLVELGFVKSKEEKAHILANALEGQDLTEESVFASCVAKVMEEAEVAEKAAAAMIRQWAKKNDVEYFKPAKPEPGERAGITKNVFDWIVENPNASNDDLFAYLQQVGTENTLRNKNFYSSVLKMASRIVGKYTA